MWDAITEVLKSAIESGDALAILLIMFLATCALAGIVIWQLIRYFGKRETAHDDQIKEMQEAFAKALTEQQVHYEGVYARITESHDNLIEELMRGQQKLNEMVADGLMNSTEAVGSVKTLMTSIQTILMTRGGSN